ncbi:amidase [Prauserella endophytica]|uniref:Amidase n=1 Tax=Prauserella endophytica TaxID=1592324 RepID=A0ABY2RVV7_9PSEU|nr:amidase [Prauserella endophytica]
MNPFLTEEETVSFPPVSSYQRAIAAFEALARSGGSAPWLSVRSREDVLVDAKAVDERLRAGESPALAGVLVGIGDDPVLAQRLARAGAVVLGTADPVGVSAAPALDVLDAALCTGLPADCRGLVALRPTRGLVPGHSGLTVLARDVERGQLVLAALTGPDESDPASREWPASVRLSAGEHPRIAVPSRADLAALSTVDRSSFAVTVDTLRAAGAVVEEIPLAERAREWAERPATILRGHDALCLPTTGTTPSPAELTSILDTAAVGFPDGRAGGAVVVTRAFDDQVGIDVVGLLSGIQADTPYPSTGIGLIVFGAYLRGQPRNGELTGVGARFTGFVETAPRYRMVALPGTPPQPGVLRAERDGAALLAERWLISPAGLGEFLAGLPAPLTLGSVELEDGAHAVAVLCDAVAAAEGTDITSYRCWRAYLRYLSTQRPTVPAPRPASG